jgi:antitoxin HigA-1
MQKRRGIPVETALRLGKALGTSADFRMNLQCKYDLRTALEEMGSKIEREALQIKE